MSSTAQPDHGKEPTRTVPEQNVTPEHIRRVLNDVRAAFADLLHSAGVDPAKTRATARQLELSRGLIWRVSTVIISADMAVGAQKIPTAGSIETLCRACGMRGASTENIDRTRAAVREFEDTVKLFSSDRKSLAMILSSMASENITDQQEPARKLAYQANSTIWGTQARVQLQSSFIAPSGNDESGTVDFASVAGLIDIRRLRSVSWPVYVAAVRADKGQSLAFTYEPIDRASSGPEGPPLLIEYCSSPLPEIRALPLEAGTLYSLAEGPIGNAGIATVTFGIISRRGQTRYRSENDEVVNFGTYMHTPVERIVMDLFVHRDLGFPLPPDVMLIDRMVHPHQEGISIEEAERKRMPISVCPRELSPGLTSSVTPQIPWYPRLLNDVYERGGWSPDDFRGYRLEMAYPPNPTVLVLGLKKPERPV